MTQMIACSFAGTSKRTYTYHNDGDPVGVGDKVKLPMRGGGEGWIPGIVEAVDVEKPTRFATRGVLGLAETAADRAARKAAEAAG